MAIPFSCALDKPRSIPPQRPRSRSTKSIELQHVWILQQWTLLQSQKTFVALHLRFWREHNQLCKSKSGLCNVAVKHKALSDQ